MIISRRLMITCPLVSLLHSPQALVYWVFSLLGVFLSSVGHTSLSCTCHHVRWDRWLAWFLTWVVCFTFVNIEVEIYYFS